MGIFGWGKQKEDEPQRYPITDEERETINDIGYKIANADTRAEQLEQVARFNALGGNDHKIIPCGPHQSGQITHYEKRKR